MVEDTISRSSICILQDRPFNGRLKAHKGAIHKLDNLEGRDYVPDCVKILLKAVSQREWFVIAVTNDKVRNK